MEWSFQKRGNDIQDAVNVPERKRKGQTNSFQALSDMEEDGEQENPKEQREKEGKEKEIETFVEEPG